MTSIPEDYSFSDDDSDYEPAVENFSEEGKTIMLNNGTKAEFYRRTRNSQNSSEASLYSVTKLKEVKIPVKNVTEVKDQSESVYKNFLEEAAAEMSLLKNENYSSEIIFSQVNTGSSANAGGSKKSCFLNASIPEVEDSGKNISSQNYQIKDSKSDLSTNSVSNLRKNSTKCSPLLTKKKRDLSFVMENVLKKGKKETILSMSMQDWQKFKEEEDITDELKLYNQGKNGYLEKKRFLERSDLRRFQIEREMRFSKKKK